MRILWLKTELLHPVDKGGKIRTYQMLKELKREHRITYLTLDDGTADKDARALAQQYCHELICVPQRQRAKFTAGFYAELAFNLASNLPYAIAKYQSAEMRGRIQQLTSEGLYDVVVCDFLAPAVNVPRTLSCPSILFQHNVEAMIWQRHFEVQTNTLKRAYLLGQWRKMRAFEGVTCRRFDRVITVSREDREVMRREYGVTAIDDVPTGVDTDFFRPRTTASRSPRNLVFTGSMDWLPNEDAIRYFTEQILPLIKQQLPDVTLTVVGRNPYPALLDLSQRDSSVIVTGRVEDVRPYMERAAAYIVPLRIGGGTRLKIFEAMAMEKAIVSTTVGAEGLPVRPGVELLLADTPKHFADEVVRVLSDEQLANDLARNASMLVRAQFGWDRVATRFAEICERLSVAKPPVADRLSDSSEVLPTAGSF
jgi:sugar transferase (PEP-CTERM/EpsH1 system associated)